MYFARLHPLLSWAHKLLPSTLHSPLGCRPSPPQGGRSACIDFSTMLAAPAFGRAPGNRIISPLEKPGTRQRQAVRGAYRRGRGSCLARQRGVQPRQQGTYGRTDNPPNPNRRSPCPANPPPPSPAACREGANCSCASSHRAPMPSRPTPSAFGGDASGAPVGAGAAARSTSSRTARRPAS